MGGLISITLVGEQRDLFGPGIECMLAVAINRLAKLRPSKSLPFLRVTTLLSASLDDGPLGIGILVHRIIST